VAQEAQDQGSADAQPGFRIDAGAVQASNDGLHANAARGMRLRVEKQLGVDHVVLRRLDKISPRHVVEILLLDKHAGAGVIDVEKTLQIGESVGAAQFFHAGVGNRYAVATGQRKNQFRLKRSLNVNMQLSLGHTLEQLGQAVGGNRVDVRFCQIHSNSKKEKPPKAAHRLRLLAPPPHGVERRLIVGISLRTH